MVEKCANPSCESPFSYFCKGKLYAFDLRAQSNKSQWQSTRLEHYWLCGACAAKMEIVVEGNGVVLRPRMPSDRAAA